MAKISLRTVKERQKQGLKNTSTTVASTEMGQSHRRVGRSLQMMQEIVADSEGLNRREICEALGRKKSPHLVDLIEHLVSCGVFEREDIGSPNGLPHYIYRLSDSPGF